MKRAKNGKHRHALFKKSSKKSFKISPSRENARNGTHPPFLGLDVFYIISKCTIFSINKQKKHHI
tara:strand:+ start:946 stop:1140 length:195 start_codon:yes stop_codon:yes gene_type:complete